MKQELTNGNSARNCRAFLLNNSVISLQDSLSLWFQASAVKYLRTALLWVNFLLMFWDNLSVPFSAFKNPKENAVAPNMGCLLDSWTLRMGPIGCPKMTVRNDHYLQHNNPGERSSLHSLCCWWISFHKHSNSTYQKDFLQLEEDEVLLVQIDGSQWHNVYKTVQQ
jgi:hypothetical protein